MHVFLSEKITKLSTLNETLHKSLEEKTTTLATFTKDLSEKSRELSLLRQKITEDSDKERIQITDQWQTMEFRHQSSMKELRLKLEHTEQKFADAKENLRVAEQTALDIEARYAPGLCCFIKSL